MSAAPLKHEDRAVNLDAAPALRAHMSAAPLKRGKRSSVKARMLGTPRSHERGPVEAEKLGVFVDAFNDDTPRSHERGPVEARRGWPRCGVRGNTPRSHERGPVEASPHGAALLHDIIPLRAHMSAAPLKQFREPFVHGGHVVTPRSHERGPVEAWQRPAARNSRWRTLRAHMSAAPLKLRLVGHVHPVPRGTPRSHERGPVEASLRRARCRE